MYLKTWEDANNELQQMDRLIESNDKFFENWLQEQDAKNESVIVTIPVCTMNKYANVV